MAQKKLKDQENEILARIKNLVSREFAVEKFIFFGSRVKNKSRQYSDYDILIVTVQELDWRQKRRISDLTLEVDLEFDVVTDVKIYSKREIEKTLLGLTPFMQNALNEGLVYE